MEAYLFIELKGNESFCRDPSHETSYNVAVYELAACFYGEGSPEMAIDVREKETGASRVRTLLSQQSLECRLRLYVKDTEQLVVGCEGSTPITFASSGKPLIEVTAEPGLYEEIKEYLTHGVGEDILYL